VNLLFKSEITYETIIQRHVLLNSVKKRHQQSGDMEEAYKCRAYFQDTITAHQLDLAVTREYCKLVQNFESNFSVRDISNLLISIA
jgi:hypothetical protein